MQMTPESVFREYRQGVDFKTALGTRGMYEQNRINERFFIGDQWHGARCGNDRPLVRHNVIKRIGNYKMSHILSAPISVTFDADGIPSPAAGAGDLRSRKRRLAGEPDYRFPGTPDTDEINLIMSALTDYRRVTAERVGFSELCDRALQNAYITGTGVLYTYWDEDVRTGMYADDARRTAIGGDIACEVLGIENVYFGDPYSDDVQAQPYILIASRKNAEDVRREALRSGAGGSALRDLTPDSDGKILVLTRLYKVYDEHGRCSVRCMKTTEKCVVRKEFDTRLRRYPIAVFAWDKRSGTAYGESEVTYLIPNQIAINRMITANVWAGLTNGMPMMVVNGDTVTDQLTNEPGQIIRIYGTNEDVAGAVRYVAPPDVGESFSGSISSLIENTLTQSGANEVARGDSRPDNATALMTMQREANMPLQLIRTRFYNFVEEVTRIWVDFWITQYGSRKLKIRDENGIWYLPFDAARYRDLMICVRVDVSADNVYDTAERVKTLTALYDKGIIDRTQFLKRLPDGCVPDMEALLSEPGPEPKEDAHDGKSDS